MRPTRGIASIKLVVALPTIVAFTWFGIELGLLLRGIQQAKIAADASALAAAARLPEDDELFRRAAITAAAANSGSSGGIVIEAVPDNAGGDLLTGVWDTDARSFSPDPESRTAVRVRVRFGADSPNEPPGFLLPNILELADITFQRSSVATWNPRPASTSLLVSGQSLNRALNLSQTALLDSFGEIGVVSDRNAAVGVGRDAVIITPTLRLTGGLTPGSEDHIQGDIVFDDDLPEDPFVGLPVPGPIGLATPPGDLGPGEIADLAPGRHPNGLVLNTGTLRLLPGIHQFGSPGLVLQNDAQVILVAASIQLLDSANLRLRGSARIRGDGPTSGLWEDVVLLGRGEGNVQITAEASVVVPGIIYLPNSVLRLRQEGSMVVDGAIVRQWLQSGASNARLDRIILTDTEIDGGRAKLRE